MYKRSPYRLFVHKWRAYPFYSYYIDHVVAGAAHAFVMYTYESRGGVRARAFVNPIKCAGHRIFTERALAR